VHRTFRLTGIPHSWMEHGVGAKIPGLAHSYRTLTATAASVAAGSVGFAAEESCK
jgi:hypothetical protein